MTRKGYCIVLQGGDAQISKALADGIAQGRLSREQTRTVEEEIVRQRVARRMEEMELHQGRDERYWANLCFQAEMDYGEPCNFPTAWERFKSVVLAVWGTIWYFLTAPKEEVWRR